MQWDAELLLLHVFNDGFWSTIKAICEAERWAGTAPVLLARRPASADFSNILVATDFSDNAMRAAQLAG